MLLAPTEARLFTSAQTVDVLTVAHGDEPGKEDRDGDIGGAGTHEYH